jgi:hypothetical protein
MVGACILCTLIQCSGSRRNSRRPLWQPHLQRMWHTANLCLPRMLNSLRRLQLHPAWPHPRKPLHPAADLQRRLLGGKWTPFNQHRRQRCASHLLPRRVCAVWRALHACCPHRFSDSKFGHHDRTCVARARQRRLVSTRGLRHGTCRAFVTRRTFASTC